MTRPLDTRRRTLAQVTLCVGCCCGQVERGHPAVPVDWLKTQWKTRRLLKHVQLTISGCLGPCDLTNVATISSAGGTTWLGELDSTHHFELLLDWATRVAAEQRVLPLPGALESHVFSRYLASSLAAGEHR